MNRNFGPNTRKLNLVPSCAWHSSSYPGVLAWLRHADPSQVLMGLKVFERHVRAVAWCEESGCAESVHMARRCMLKSQLMDWARRQGESTNFTSVSDLFREFLQEMWQGGLNTVNNERANQRIRDLATRQNPSKETNRIAMWEAAARAGWTEHWQRRNVHVQPSEAEFGRDLDLKQLFEPRGTTYDSAMPFDELLKDNKWQTWTSQSIKRSYGEMELMSIAYDRKDKALISKAWKCGLVPCLQVVVIYKTVKGKKTIEGSFLVLWNTGIALQTLTVGLGRDKGTVHLKVDSGINWRVIDDLSNVYIVPTKGASPLRAMVTQRTHPTVRTGCQLQVVGDPVELLTWQQARGFANVNEYILKRLCLAHAAPQLPPEAEVAGLEEDRLVTRICMALNSDLTVEDLVAALSKRTALEDGTGEEIEPIDQEIMDDVLDPSDRKEAMATQAGAQQKKLERVRKQRSQASFTECMLPILKSKRRKKDKTGYIISKLGYKEKTRWNDLDPDVGFFT